MTRIDFLVLRKQNVPLAANAVAAGVEKLVDFQLLNARGLERQFARAEFDAIGAGLVGVVGVVDVVGLVQCSS